MKVAIITDQHFDVRSSSSEFLDFQEKCYGQFIVPEILKRGITTVFDLGDTFDRRKYVNIMSYKRSKEMWFDRLRNNDIKLHSLVGNHTTYFRNTNDVNTMDLVLEAYPNATVYREPTEIEVDGLKILMMPWINSGNHKHCFDMIKNTNAQILFGHLEIKGFEMYKGLPSHDGYDESLFDKFDIVASGHFHKKSQRGNIHYLGAPYQMTWSDYDCPRGFHIFDTDTREFEYIVNPFSIFHKVRYNDEGKQLEDFINVDYSYIKGSYVKVIVQTKKNPYWFDIFLNQLYDKKPLDISIVEDHRNMQTLSDEDIISNAEDTPTILSNYVAGLEMKNGNKNELDNLLRELYNEALDLTGE